MKVDGYFAVLLAALVSWTLPHSSLACRCRLPPQFTPISDNEALFRATVLRELVSANETSSSSMKKYVVNVKRIYTGCTFKASDRIVVTTPTSSCRTFLDINTEYVLSGNNAVLDAATKQQLGRNSKITRAVYVTACDYTRTWTDVSTEERTSLRTAYNNTCPRPCDAKVDCRTADNCTKRMTIASISTALLFATIALFLPLWTLACECPNWPPSPSDASDTLFRGVVLRELTADTTARKFVVDVKRIFTGCTFDAAERIVVTTTPLPELCGQDLVIDRESVGLAY